MPPSKLTESWVPLARAVNAVIDRLRHAHPTLP